MQEQHLLSIVNLVKLHCSLPLLKKLHSLLLTSGFIYNDTIFSNLISSTLLFDAHYSFRILSRLDSPNIFYWNSFIRSCSANRNPNDSFKAFIALLRRDLAPDHLTYPILMRAASRLNNKQLGSTTHAHLLRKGFSVDRFVANSMIHMYGSCLEISDARKVFDETQGRNTVSWNSMLDSYAKFGDMISARVLFEEMPERDVISWSSLIDGYVKTKELQNAIAVFDDMLVCGPTPNEVTMVSVLCACAHFGAISKGRSMHRFINDRRLPLTLTLRTSLVDMYSKCGAIEEALALFRECPREKTDVLIWNAIIGGLASHGLFKESLKLYEEMLLAGETAKPDDITYLCLLSACVHGGMVKEAWHFFGCLREPKIEHYACLVDAMARAGQVEEAFEFINNMAEDPSPSMLGAVFNGCMNHKKMTMAEVIGKKLIDIDPYHDGRYIGLSNVYAYHRRWDEANGLRNSMERKGIKKCAGQSCTEISGTIHRFNAHHASHPSMHHMHLLMNLIAHHHKFHAAHFVEAEM